jgi:hypothetical protein
LELDRISLLGHGAADVRSATAPSSGPWRAYPGQGGPPGATGKRSPVMSGEDDRNADASDFAGSGDIAAGQADLPTRFRRHAHGLERAGRSPLTVALMRGAADDIAAGGIVARLFADIPLPPGQAPALRLMAALHRLVLEGRAPALDRYYASVGGSDAPKGVWAVAQKTLEAHAGNTRAALLRGVQTNEPGRSAVLYGVLLWVWQRWGFPVRLFEIGASAGLNLLAPDYAYRVGETLLGDKRSQLVFDDPWLGTPVGAVREASDQLVVSTRRGCDIAPIVATSAQGRLTLLSYIWPDENDRITRMRAALAVAGQCPPIVDEEEADSWLTRVLRAPGAHEVRVIWQSVFAQYLTPRARSKLESEIEVMGWELGEDSPLVWARMEPENDPALGFTVKVRCWPGGEETTLARAGDHGPPVRWIV